MAQIHNWLPITLKQSSEKTWKDSKNADLIEDLDIIGVLKLEDNIPRQLAEEEPLWELPRKNEKYNSFLIRII